MAKTGRQLLEKLISKGVRVPSPESVEIGSEVNPDRISGDGVTIHSGCRMNGSRTLISPGVELGSGGPVVVRDCQMGEKVCLEAGTFLDSCFLDGAAMGPGAHVREACLLEEGARGAHTVGIKHTILFPFVTLGSLINFCDCLMAGGTDKKNHSEVGSSYIHFNYTPSQHKATPSLLGDVPKGVMLNQPPIFLGGQGGIVGPVKIAFGSVVAAGTIVRKDLLHENRILLGHRSLSRTIPFQRGFYPNIKRLVELNCHYISNLIALRRWYLDVRSSFFAPSPFKKALWEGALDKLKMAVEERVERLGEVAERMPESIENDQRISRGEPRKTGGRRERELFERWEQIVTIFQEEMASEGDPSRKDAFLKRVQEATQREGKRYLEVIRSLTQQDAEIGTLWLQGLVDGIMARVWKALPSFVRG